MSYLDERRKHIEAGRPAKPKKIYRIPKVSAKRALEIKNEKEKGTDKPEDDYFEYHMKHSEPVCENCGGRWDWVKEPGNEKIWMACQAHVLPKRKTYGFPSLAGNLDNHLVLFPSWGGHFCGCHGFFDSNWYNATTTEVWPKAVEIFKRLYPLIPEKEKKNIPEQFLKELQ